MDRRIFYRDELLFESELMEIGRFAYEGLGFLSLDVLGATASVAGFPCAPTVVPSLSFLLGPGRIYQLMNLDATAMGQTGGVGGLPADTNADHQILKQALYRNTVTLGPLVAPVTTGQSQVFLVEAQFAEADDTPTLTQFYNTAAPLTPITSTVTTARRDIVAVQIKAGVAATTGTQVAPAPDSGWLPLYAITLAHGQTTIGAGDIAVAPTAPFAHLGVQIPVREITLQANPVSGTVTLDFALGNYFKVLMNGTISTVTFLNLPPSGIAQQITVDFIGDGTTRTVTGLGAANIKWMGATGAGTQPTFLFTAGYENTVVFVARDGVARQKASFSGISAA